MTINEPAGNGAYEGDEFYGLENNPLITTHVWHSGQWHRVPMVMGTTEDPIPGLEDIPADIPNAPEGDMPLNYDVQTFNALAAANTAMQTEISSYQEKFQMLVNAAERDREALAIHQEAMVESREREVETRATIKSLQDALSKQSKTADEYREIAKRADETLMYERDRATALNLQLERMKGYLDRTLETDEQFDKSPAVPEKPLIRPRGPRISEIQMPQKPSDRGSIRMFEGESIRMSDGPAPRNF